MPFSKKLFRCDAETSTRDGRAPHRSSPRGDGQSPLSSLERLQIVGYVWIFRGQRFNIPDFDVDFLYAGPFCARAEEPTPLSDDACSVESIARNHKLYTLPRFQIRTYDDALACSIFVQHKNYNGITQVTVIELIVANAMESHGCIGRHHEIERRARWPAIKKWCWEPAGRNSLVADERDAHETAGGVRLEVEQCANLFGC